MAIIADKQNWKQTWKLHIANSKKQPNFVNFNKDFDYCVPTTILKQQTKIKSIFCVCFFLQFSPFYSMFTLQRYKMYEENNWSTTDYKYWTTHQKKNEGKQIDELTMNRM